MGQRHVVLDQIRVEIEQKCEVLDGMEIEQRHVTYQSAAMMFRARYLHKLQSISCIMCSCGFGTRKAGWWYMS